MTVFCASDGFALPIVELHVSILFWKLSKLTTVLLSWESSALERPETMGEKSAMPNWSGSSCLQGTRFSTISWRCDLEASLEFDGAVVLAVTSTVDLVPDGILSLRLVPPLGPLLFFAALRPVFDVPGFFLPLALLVLMYGGN